MECFAGLPGEHDASCRHRSSTSRTRGEEVDSPFRSSSDSDSSNNNCLSDEDEVKGEAPETPIKVDVLAFVKRRDIAERSVSEMPHYAGSSRRRQKAGKAAGANCVLMDWIRHGVNMWRVEGDDWTEKYVLKMFLVPKPEKGVWCLMLDFRWLNPFFVKLRCKMESLKKLRRLVKKNDWMFNFGLKEACFNIGIHRDL
ncbi:hypothetical protein CYMTET_55351 [Cymbomonas tetramitiformis]|uniref:Uncharacterized protein n=1 Tax=Cymbomonas tetramitiformis TaxID=36881 RepID=A0AAE0BEX2_9CHLO|nr:hypothetical protein CYMTET_55351 [Cymbomonas tetramitiformis]